MNKLFTLIALGVLIVAGMITLIVSNNDTLGLSMSIPGIILMLIVALLEPADAKNVAPKEQKVGDVPIAPVRLEPLTERKPVAKATSPEVSTDEQVAPKPAIPVQVDSKAESKPEASPSAEADLLKEVAELTALVERKTKESEQLAAKLKDRRDTKILQRVAQFHLALEFNRKMMAAGKMDEAKALREVELELEAALEELGIKPYPIEAGMKLRDLPNGAFELLKAEAPETPELAGTVKAVHQSAVTYRDPDGHTHFLIPAKLDARKLS